MFTVSPVDANLSHILVGSHARLKSIDFSEPERTCRLHTRKDYGKG